jgi:hypothetical protein
VRKPANRARLSSEEREHRENTAVVADARWEVDQ